MITKLGKEVTKEDKPSVIQRSIDHVKKHPIGYGLGLATAATGALLAHKFLGKEKPMTTALGRPIVTAYRKPSGPGTGGFNTGGFSTGGLGTEGFNKMNFEEFKKRFHFE